MIPNKIETFEDFLDQSFGEGVYCRELRLSKEEFELVQKKYPNASIERCSQAAASDGKCWYEVNLLAPKVEKAASQSRLTAIQNENRRLKLELEQMKKSLGMLG